MKRLTTLVTAIMVLAAINVSAQQEPQVSHNMFNHMAINPGYAGAENSICATALFRKQWLGFEGSPTTFLLSLDAPVPLLKGGLGINLVSDRLGFESNTLFKLAYAFRMPVGPGAMGIGLMAGFHNKALDFSKLKPEDAFPSEGTQHSNDPLIRNIYTRESDMLFDIAGGVYYQIPDQMYVGLSASQLLAATGEYSNSQAPLNLARHIYFTGGYQYQLNTDFDLLPSLMVKTDLASTQIDINALALYQKKFWGGLSYRAQDAIVILLGAHLPQNITAGYAYDVTTSAIGAHGRSSGSHEIMVRYCFKIVVEPKISSYKNVRFL